MRRPSILAVVLSLCLLGEVAATRIVTKPLEDVVTAQTWVMEARLISSELERGRYHVQSVYKVEPISVLHGTGSRASLRYSSPLPHKREVDGKVMSVSPLITGSGIEHSLEEGRVYLFLAPTNPTGETAEFTLIRVESRSRKKQLLEHLKALNL